MTFSRLCAGALGIVLASGFALGCSGDATGSDAQDLTSGVTFAAESEPLKGFSFDTGLVPAGSPAQVSLKISAGGTAKVSAAGAPNADGLVGKKGGGKIALDLHVKMDGRLKIDSPFKKVDTDLPGLSDIDIPIVEEIAFDPFLTGEGESATVTANIPETTLPPIPLGSVPGSLVITIASGSVVTSSFHGTCISVADGQASYTGRSVTGGKLVLKGSLELDLPSPLNKTIDLGEIPVKLPKAEKALAFESQAADGAGDMKQGSTCPADAPGASGEGETETGTGSSGGSTEPSPLPKGFKVTIDGKPGTPLRSTFISEDFDGDIRYTAVLYFVGPGMGTDTRFEVRIYEDKDACFVGNRVTLKPDDGIGYPYVNAYGAPGCGLTTTAVGPTRVAGSYSGTMNASYGVESSKKVDLTFDVRK